MYEDPPLPEVFGRAEALAVGLTRNQIETRLRRGEWIALRRGVFCRRETFESTAPNKRHVLHAAASRRARPSADLVESHLTAAAHWGLPMPLDGTPRGSLTDGCLAHPTRADGGSVIQVATLWPGDIRERGAAPVTAPARTIADCLRHYDAEVSVPIADAGLHAGLAGMAEVSRMLGRQANWPYSARAAASLPLVDGRREGWLESISVVRLWRLGVEPAEPQVEVFDDSGTFVARVDSLWRSQATVGEADGSAKYSLADWPDLAATDPEDLADAHIEAARRVVRREKAREDALRATGLEVVRWGTAEIIRAAPTVARRIQLARSRGDVRRFTGTLRSTACP
jgi:hypothetical protein